MYSESTSTLSVSTREDYLTSIGHESLASAFCRVLELASIPVAHSIFHRPKLILPETTNRTCSPVRPKRTIFFDIDRTLLFSKRLPNCPADHWHFVCNTENPSLTRYAVIRRGVISLLSFLKNHPEDFEMFVYTAGTAEYADKICNSCFPGFFPPSHRLSREHTVPVTGLGYLKPLSIFNRDLNQCVLIDDTFNNYFFQVKNTIAVDPFSPDLDPTSQELYMNDHTMMKLLAVFEKLQQWDGDVPSFLESSVYDYSRLQDIYCDVRKACDQSFKYQRNEVFQFIVDRDFMPFRNLSPYPQIVDDRMMWEDDEEEGESEDFSDAVEILIDEINPFQQPQQQHCVSSTSYVMPSSCVI